MNKLAIFKLKEHLDKEYIKLIKNKEYNKIDQRLIKILRNILEETIIIVEKNKLNKYIEEFENIELRILDYVKTLKYNESFSTNIKLKIPLLKEKAEEEYLNNLKENFDLLKIKEDLTEMFSLIELTIYHIEDLNVFYDSYNKELNSLIKEIKIILKETEKEKKQIEETNNNSDLMFFEGLETDLNNIITSFIETREILKIFIKRMDNLKDTLNYFNIRFKDVFKRIINLRTKLIKGKLENNITINEYKNILNSLKDINKKKKD